MASLFDEHSTNDFRHLFGNSARTARRIEVAISRVRLSQIDLRPDEVSGVLEIRVLIAQINASGLSEEARTVLADPQRAANLRLLKGMVRNQQLLVRAAPLAGWAPDFSVFHDVSGPAVLLVGPHRFERPYPFPGPAFVSLHDAPAAQHASDRFNQLWARAHDIRPAIQASLERAERMLLDET